MPVFRIVYIDTDRTDDANIKLRTLTAAFENRATAEAAMAKHGHRIAHLAEMGQAESLSDPVTLSIASGFTAIPRRHRDDERASATHPFLGMPRYDLAAMAVVIAGAMMTGAAIWLF